MSEAEEPKTGRHINPPRVEQRATARAQLNREAGVKRADSGRRPAIEVESSWEKGRGGETRTTIVEGPAVTDQRFLFEEDGALTRISVSKFVVAAPTKHATVARELIDKRGRIEHAGGETGVSKGYKEPVYQIELARDREKGTWDIASEVRDDVGMKNFNRLRDPLPSHAGRENLTPTTPPQLEIVGD